MEGGVGGGKQGDQQGGYWHNPGKRRWCPNVRQLTVDKITVVSQYKGILFNHEKELCTDTWLQCR